MFPKLQMSQSHLDVVVIVTIVTLITRSIGKEKAFKFSNFQIIFIKLHLVKKRWRNNDTQIVFETKY